MSKIHFTGTHYRAPEYYFATSGDYEVTDDKAEQLVRDFPDQFSSDNAPESPAASKPDVEADQSPPVEAAPISEQPNFKDMKRAELNAYATQSGVKDADQLPNIDAVIAAIEGQTKASDTKPKE